MWSNIYYAIFRAHKKIIFVFLTQILVISTGLIDRRAQTLIGQHLPPISFVSRWGRSFIGSHADSVISREVDKDICTLFQLIAAHNMASFTHPHFDCES